MSKITKRKVLPFHEFSTFRTVLSGVRPLLIRATRGDSDRRAKLDNEDFFFRVGLFNRVPMFPPKILRLTWVL